MRTAQKKIVLIGGGFAGVNFIKKTARSQHYHITLVDINNYHFFPPLLYQVASAFIEPSNISYPFRRMFQQKNNLHFHLGALQRVNIEDNSIETDTGRIEYDYLILAHGTVTNYFGMENVKKNALPMKTVGDAINLRNHVLMNFEEAARTKDTAEREKLLNIVIAGGGPTGVEIAGMLAEMNLHIAWKEYPELNGSVMQIHLIDAAPVLLGPMSSGAQAEAQKVLKSLGVKVMTGMLVKDYVDGVVHLGDGSSLRTHTLIWASGVTGVTVPGLPAESTGKGNRIMVDAYNKVIGCENIFAAGDICLQRNDAAFPDGHPQLAQVAIQQGILLAKNMKRLAEGRAMTEFRYKDKGSMAIISKYKAVTDFPGGFVKGFFAWLLWLFIHIMPIAGFRNKVWLAFNWFWAFLTNDPTLRLIIRPGRRKDDV